MSPLALIKALFKLADELPRFILLRKYLIFNLLLHVLIKL